ncbi:MAG: tetratricopeptide repeat protein [Anaerolineae bacterium]|nr:tetratricopeptide repeat protein [Anaerolineae bacterium]
MVNFTSHEAAAHEAGALPVMLPTKLIGREAALAQIYGQLKQNLPVLVYGAAGAGKTALAATLASAYAQQPGGVLWFNVDDDPLESLITRVGRAYEISEVITSDTPTAHIGAVAAALTQHKPLIVLDGRLGGQVASKFVTRCADRLPVLIVSRENLTGPWGSVEIGPLEPTAAVLMFRQEAALTTPEHDAAILTLVKALNHQPFAIGVAARAMLAAKQTPAAYAGVLAPMIAQTGGNSALAVLAASFSTLNGALQGVVLVLGATPRGEASPELLSLMSGAPADSVTQALGLLSNLRLVERFNRYGNPYFRLHSITHGFAQARLKQSDRLEALQGKFREAIVAYAQKYSSGMVEAQNRLAMEMENFLAAVHTHSDLATPIVAALNGAGAFVRERGYTHEVIRLRGVRATGAFPAYPAESVRPPEDDLLQKVFSDDEEDIDDFDDDDLIEIDDDHDDDLIDVDDEQDEAENVPPWLKSNSPILQEIDEEDLDSELYETVEEETAPTEIPIPNDLDGLRASLTLARQQGNREKQVEILNAIGKLQIGQRQHSEALITYNEALSGYEGLNQPQGILDTLEMLSALMVKTDNAQAAVLNANRGIKLAEDLRDNETKLQLLITLGDARTQLGESDQAARVYGQALTMTRNTDDTQHEAIVLYKLGLAQLDSGDSESAVDTLEQALKLFKTQNKRDYEGRVLGALGSAYGELGRWAEAINFHTSALYIAREVKDREEEGLQLSSLGYAALQSEQLSQAVLRYRQALHLAYQAHNRDNIVSSIIDLVRLLSRSQRHLTICELLIHDAEKYEAHDKDVRQLKERISNEKLLAAANQVDFLAVNGTAEQYAANAYRLLDE